MIFDGHNDDWTRHDAACHLDRLAVTGVLFELRRARPPRLRELLALVAIPIVAVGFVLMLSLVLR